MTIALERGRTDVADRVVERLAARAVTEVAGVGGSAHRVLGVAVGDQEAVQVTARVTGDRAELDVRLSVVYPECAHLVARTEELTGLVVSKVDITVTELRTATARHRRVE